ncbi:hypothetical protein [Saliphagus sp. LR7]|uniref:hypothetical protein n=1 Tax=Saliphagus sp. LR7 TaxID=2282654 RepID=UPI000DF816E0|nr:hypothetical protein [Saliphagus sp. LR7]
MSDRRLVAGSLLAAIVATAAVSLVTESPAVLGATPTGIAVYLVVGLAVPQYLLARREGSPLRLGLAAFGAAGAALALIAGGIGGNVNATLSVGLPAVLAIVVLGVLLGAIVREFRTGYRSQAG